MSVEKMGDYYKEKWLDLADKVQSFEKWLSLGTPFENAKYDHSRVLEEFRKTFAKDLELSSSSLDQKVTGNEQK